MLPGLPLASPQPIIVKHRQVFRAGCGFQTRCAKYVHTVMLMTKLEPCPKRRWKKFHRVFLASLRCNYCGSCVQAVDVQAPDWVCPVCADCDEKDEIREISRQATEEISQVKK